jgi:hypothetical protein
MPAPKRPTKGELILQNLKLRQALELTSELLAAVKRQRFHEPNSDFMEYCNGCQTNPYVPHAEGCLVPRIARALKEVQLVLEQE